MHNKTHPGSWWTVHFVLPDLADFQAVLLKKAILGMLTAHAALSHFVRQAVHLELLHSIAAEHTAVLPTHAALCPELPNRACTAELTNSMQQIREPLHRQACTKSYELHKALRRAALPARHSKQSRLAYLGLQGPGMDVLEQQAPGRPEA